MSRERFTSPSNNLWNIFYVNFQPILRKHELHSVKQLYVVLQWCTVYKNVPKSWHCWKACRWIEKNKEIACIGMCDVYECIIQGQPWKTIMWLIFHVQISSRQYILSTSYFKMRDIDESSYSSRQPWAEIWAKGLLKWSALTNLSQALLYWKRRVKPASNSGRGSIIISQ